MPGSHRSRHPVHGFTLIELLVVVSIIALLLGVLLPAMSGARTAALQAVSSSNLRQLGIAMNVYMDDHDGTMPRSTHFGDGVDSWILTLRPYINAPGTNASFGDELDNTAFDRVRLCPADPQGAARLQRGGSSYILNQHLADAVRDPFTLEVLSDFSNRRFINCPSCTYTLFIAADGKPAELAEDHAENLGWQLAPTPASRWGAVLADIEPGRFGGTGPDVEPSNESGISGEDMLEYERTGRSSYLFFDGHVASIEAEVLAQLVIAEPFADFTNPGERQALAGGLR
ncbi:MAG: prepilin-type N-terminal cleavage/methylation domain-containing protein [Planctomycetota bacterium]